MAPTTCAAPAPRRSSRIQVRPHAADRRPGRRAGCAAPRPDAAAFFRPLAAARRGGPAAAWHAPPPPGVARASRGPAAMRPCSADAAAGGRGPHRRGDRAPTDGPTGGPPGGEAPTSATTSTTGRPSPGSASPDTSRPRTAVHARRRRSDDHATLRFPPGGEPRVGGFWSLTVYGRDLFLVENELGRYSIGDRTPGFAGTPTARSPSPSATTVRPTRATGCRHRPARASWPCAPTRATPEVVDARWFPPDLTSADRPPPLIGALFGIA